MYGGKQLERKARHLQDFGRSIEGKTPEELAMEYKELVETLVAKPGVVVRKDGKLNKQEATINIGDPETLGVVIFENNPLYDNYHFISCYPISDDAFEDFKDEGSIGLSPEERVVARNKQQKIQAQLKREASNARSFYSSLPEDARIGNQQLREAQTIQEQLKDDPNLPLTEKQRNLLERAKKYQQHK